MIRVLLIDQSAAARKILSEGLARNGDIEVVGAVLNPTVGLEWIARRSPDVIVLDSQLPETDGVAFLTSIAREQQLPVVVATGADSSTHAAILAAGAVAVIQKPDSPSGLEGISAELVRAVRFAASRRTAKRALLAASSTRPGAQPQSLPRSLIVIGASTGGTQAIEFLLRALRDDVPPVLIVQHMPEAFTASFAQRLDKACPMKVREARNGDALETGVALLAPGDSHMVLERRKNELVVSLKDGPPVHHQRPSVDVLFESVAELAARAAIGVLLTGMGSDGAKGLLAMRRNGSLTIAQDEKSCVVYGMPKEAARLGAAAKVTPLSLIPQVILGNVRQPSQPCPVAP